MVGDDAKLLPEGDVVEELNVGVLDGCDGSNGTDETTDSLTLVANTDI